MDDQTKYHLRLITKTGNAFEAITRMTMTEVETAINDPDLMGFAWFKAINQVGAEVSLRVIAENIEGIMHQGYVKVQV